MSADPIQTIFGRLRYFQGIVVGKTAFAWMRFAKEFQVLAIVWLLFSRVETNILLFIYSLSFALAHTHTSFSSFAFGDDVVCDDVPEIVNDRRSIDSKRMAFYHYFECKW